MKLKKITLFVFSLVSLLLIEKNTASESFDYELKNLSRNTYSNATAIWKHVYGTNNKAEIVTKRISDAYEKFPLITQYKEIFSDEKAHITLCFKSQYTDSSISPGENHKGSSYDHAGLVFEFKNKYGSIQPFYYDLALKPLVNGEQTKSSGDSVSGASGEYKVRRLGSDFIINAFLFAKEPLHYEVGYYIHKTFIVDFSKLNYLKNRLDSDHFKNVFPYTYTGKYNHNCITYIAQALEDVGIIKQSFCMLYYDAEWLRDIANSVGNGKRFTQEEDKRYKKSRDKKTETFVFSNEIQERVIGVLISNLKK